MCIRDRYDEYPDQLQLRLMCRRVYDRMMREEKEELEMADEEDVEQQYLSLIHISYFFVRFSCGVFGKKVLHFTVYPIGDHGCAGRRTQHILLCLLYTSRCV